MDIVNVMAIVMAVIVFAGMVYIIHRLNVCYKVEKLKQHIPGEKAACDEDYYCDLF